MIEYIEATIEVLSTEAGGRKGYFASGYRPQFFYDNYDWDCCVTLLETSQANPGDTVKASLVFTRPEIHTPKLHVGKIFLLREGHRTIGFGAISKIQYQES